MYTHFNNLKNNYIYLNKGVSMSSWLDGFYLYLGRCAPGDAKSSQIKDFLLKQGSSCIVCVTDDELCTLKNKLKKTEIVKNKTFTIYDRGTSNEIGSFISSNVKQNQEVSFIKPSEIRKASKTYKEVVKTDAEKHKASLEKLKIMQENARRNAEKQRELKIKEMLEKGQKEFVEMARAKLEEELRLKDLELEKELKKKLDEDFEEFFE